MEIRRSPEGVSYALAPGQAAAEKGGDSVTLIAVDGGPGKSVPADDWLAWELDEDPPESGHPHD